MDSGTGIFEVLGPVVLLISALLTAGYLLPVMVDGYFPGAATGYEDEKKAEPGALMLVPMFILCAGSLLVGIFGSSFMGGLTF
jgi:multicomponent Na+:H+ antiporter subunit D